MANHLLDERWFEWQVVSIDGRAVTASNRVRIEPDGALESANEVDLTIVCAS